MNDVEQLKDMVMIKEEEKRVVITHPMKIEAKTQEEEEQKIRNNLTTNGRIYDKSQANVTIDISIIIILANATIFLILKSRQTLLEIMKKWKSPH